MRERFGSKCLRVFRLLLLKKVLEQKQVVDMAMIPSKEARELLYTLLAENFVSLQVYTQTDTVLVWLMAHVLHSYKLTTCVHVHTPLQYSSMPSVLICLVPTHSFFILTFHCFHFNFILVTTSHVVTGDPSYHGLCTF